MHRTATKHHPHIASQTLHKDNFSKNMDGMSTPAHAKAIGKRCFESSVQRRFGFNTVHNQIVPQLHRSILRRALGEGRWKTMIWWQCWMLVSAGWLSWAAEYADKRISEKSPLFQHLPQCNDSLQITPPKRLTRSSWKGILCPMVKDEVGFLSEWVAFYEVQGFSKIIFFDNNSTTSFAELNPWVETGFVEIIRGPWWNERWLFRNKKKKFMDMMYVKYKAEVICKEKAVALGYDIFASVDIDEYILPLTPGANMTVMDEMESWFLGTKRGIMPMNKLNFNSVPHLLEPLNLLTIEAYHTRNYVPNRMNFYNSVAPKIAVRLQQPENLEFNNDTQVMNIACNISSLSLSL